nr:MAG TPA: hypothetical protein [Caudoviricetes sp.]
MKMPAMWRLTGLFYFARLWRNAAVLTVKA